MRQWNGGHFFLCLFQLLVFRASRNLSLKKSHYGENSRKQILSKLLGRLLPVFSKLTSLKLSLSASPINLKNARQNIQANFDREKLTIQERQPSPDLVCKRVLISILSPTVTVPDPPCENHSVCVA